MRAYLFVAVCVVIACSRRPTAAPAPAFVIGEFQDDYGSRHTVTATEWLHHPRSRYHIVQWAPDQHFLIAQNDSANPGAPKKWTRIDWVRLDGMAPYEWAFCLSAYEAPTAAAAEATTIAKPETPRTGCNGFPFTRMKRAVASP